MEIVIWLERVGVAPSQVMTDIQTVGLNLALLRVALGVGAKLGESLGRGMTQRLHHRQLPA